MNGLCLLGQNDHSQGAVFAQKADLFGSEKMRTFLFIVILFSLLPEHCAKQKCAG